MPGPDRDFSESRIDILSALEEAHLPEYPDLASAPDKEGLTVTVTGEGADPAGTYTFISGQWSGPMGGESNLPDTNLDSGPVANTEQYSYGEYLTGAVDPDNAKHVTTDLDTAATDKRYLRILVDSFDHHAATDPGSDQPTTPQTWRFVPGESSAAVPGGYFYDATPSGTQSARSFGCDFTSTTAPDDSTISSSAWAIEKEYAVGAGGHTLDVSAWAQPTASYSAYDDGMAPSPEEAFLGEDDVFVAIEAFDSSLQSLALDTTTEFSRTASHQHFAGTDSGDLGGDEWVEFSHEATLPAATAFVRVRLQTAAHSNTWSTRGNAGSGNAAIVLDDYSASYTAGLRESAVLAHDHEGVYAGQGEFDSHVSDDAAHHSRYTDTDAQQALSGHTSDASAHHAKRTDAQVADALTDEFINPPGIGGAVDRPQSVSTDQIITDVVDADQIGTAGNPVSSVDTEQLSIEGLATGQTHELVNGDIDGDRVSGSFVQWTDGVGSSATAIYDASDFNGLCLVWGRGVGTNSTDFLDVVVSHGWTGADVISESARNGAAERTYSVDETTLELSMASGSYNIGVRATSVMYF